MHIQRPTIHKYGKRIAVGSLAIALAFGMALLVLVHKRLASAHALAVSNTITMLKMWELSIRVRAQQVRIQNISEVFLRQAVAEDTAPDGMATSLYDRHLASLGTMRQMTAEIACVEIPQRPRLMANKQEDAYVNLQRELMTARDEAAEILSHSTVEGEEVDWQGAMAPKKGLLAKGHSNLSELERVLEMKAKSEQTELAYDDFLRDFAALPRAKDATGDPDDLQDYQQAAAPVAELYVRLEAIDIPPMTEWQNPALYSRYIRFLEAVAGRVY